MALGEVALPFQLGGGEPVAGLRAQELGTRPLEGGLQEGPLELEQHRALGDWLVLFGGHREHPPTDLRRQLHRSDRREDRRDLGGDRLGSAARHLDLDRERILDGGRAGHAGTARSARVGARAASRSRRATAAGEVKNITPARRRAAPASARTTNGTSRGLTTRPPWPGRRCRTGHRGAAA